ncbi:hypothetical protein [Thermus sp.]|uniref:hypothetical protein n=1 Tax=Thermus sp. TaxID=275 RepID=UPI0026297061|nr:hypothetical protein [Thermus sp.]
MAVWPLPLVAGLLGLALGQPLLLAREEEVRLLWAGEVARAALEALAEAPSPEALAALEEGLALLSGRLGPYPGLLSRLEALGAEARRAGEETGGLRPLLPQAFSLLEAVQEALVPRVDPPLRAGLMAQMALGAEGVAARYREGFLLGREAYRLGFFLLWRLWIHADALRPHLPPAAWGRVREGLSLLQGLYPSSAFPPYFRDPEEARQAALDLVYALEAGLGVDLLPRDPRANLAYLLGLAQRACQGPQAREGWQATRLFFHSHLLPVLGATFPSLAEPLARALGKPFPDCGQVFSWLQEALEAPGWE